MMDLKSDLEAWYGSGDRVAGARLVETLAARVALPPSFARALGAEVAAEVEQESLVRLLDRERRLLVDARDPLAFAATVSRNLARDELRRHRRRGDLGEDREQLDEQVVADTSSTDVASGLDTAKALALLAGVSEDGRLAVFLLHAPERMPSADWALVASRHPPPPPARPAGPLDRDEASALLWPPPVPETRPARRRRHDRLRKVVMRTYARLAEALGTR